MIASGAITVSEKYTSSNRTVLDADIASFTGDCGNFNRLPEFFAVSTIHQGRNARGMLVASIVSGLRSRLDDYAILGWMETQRRFVAPVFPGDTLAAAYEVVEACHFEIRPDTSVVTLAATVKKQTVEAVQTDGDILSQSKVVPDGAAERGGGLYVQLCRPPSTPLNRR